MGRDGTRLNPRKADLQQWRELFAEKLRDNGIEANATKRPVRGVVRKPIKQPLIHMEKRGQKTRNRLEQEEAVKEAIKTGAMPPNPHAWRIANTRAAVAAACTELSTALNNSNHPQDHALAIQLTQFAGALLQTETAREAAVRLYKQETERALEVGDQNRNKSRDVDR